MAESVREPSLKGGPRRSALDDPKQVEKLDKSAMLAGLAEYPAQLKDAWALGDGLAAAVGIREADGVVFAGMGGSGVGADLAAALFRDAFQAPLAAAKDYDLPGWAGPRTLVVLTSYSGETEETLSSFVEATRRGCRTLTLSSGGSLEKFSKLTGGRHVRVPGGLQPRAALAYLAVPLLRLLHDAQRGAVEVDMEAAAARAAAVVESCAPSVPLDENPAKRLAAFVGNRIPVVFANGYLDPVARRWKTQFNENAKALAYCDTIPESNHNDLVAWSGGDRGLNARMCGLFLRRDDEPDPLRTRFAFVESVVGQVTEAKSVEVEGATPFERMVHALVLGDFASVYLALLRGVDPSPVQVIHELKAQVGKLKLANRLDTDLRALLRSKKA